MCEGRSVVEERVGAPHEGDAEGLATDFDEGKIAQFGRELRIGGNFCEVERLGEAGTGDGGGDIAGGRDDVVVGSAAAAQFGDEVVAGTHVGGGDFAVVSFFEGVDEGRIRVTFPDEKAEGVFAFVAGGEEKRRER